MRGDAIIGAQQSGIVVRTALSGCSFDEPFLMLGMDLVLGMTMLLTSTANVAATAA